MAEEVLARYTLEVSNINEVGAKVQSVTSLFSDQQKQIKATYADKSIEQATTNVKQFGDSVGQATTKLESLRGQVRQNTNQLAEMRIAGEQGTKQYEDLVNETSKLSKQLRLATEEIGNQAKKFLALRASAEGLRSIAAGYQGILAVQSLFGDKSEDSAKALEKLFAAQAALNTITEISTALEEESTLRKGLSAAATFLQTTATTAYYTSLAVLLGELPLVTAAQMALNFAASLFPFTAIALGIGVIVEGFLIWKNKSGELRNQLEADLAEIKARYEEVNAAIEYQIKLQQIEGAQTFDLSMKKIQAAKDELRERNAAYDKMVDAGKELTAEELKDYINAFKEKRAIDRQEAIAILEHQKELEKILHESAIKRLESETESRERGRLLIDLQYNYEKDRLDKNLKGTPAYYTALQALDQEHEKKLTENDQHWNVERFNNRKKALDLQVDYFGQNEKKELALKIESVFMQAQIDKISLKDTADRREKQRAIDARAEFEAGKLRAASAEKIYEQQYQGRVAALKAVIADEDEQSALGLQARLDLLDIEAGAEVEQRTKGIEDEKVKAAIIEQITAETNSKREKEVEAYYDKLREYRQKDIDSELAHSKALNALARNKVGATDNDRAGADIGDVEAEAKALKQSIANYKAADAEILADKTAGDDKKIEAHKKYLKKIQELEDQLALTVEKSQNLQLEKFKAMFAHTASDVKQITTAIGDIFKAVSENQLAAVQQSFDSQNLALDKWHTHALDTAGDNAQKRAIIEKRYAAQHERLQQQQAIKEAQIKRKQAEMEKVIHIVNIIAGTAENVVKVFPNPVLIALAIATGAASAAVAAAQPLPPIPKFEKGGPVPLGHGKIKDGHLFGHSHRQGGMLINAEGGEYIWDRTSVAKHGDIIKAAHENRIEQLVFHKYLVPLMNKQTSSGSAANSYDDFTLRTDVKGVTRTSRQNTKEIVRAIRETGSNNYLNSRYHA